MGVIACLCFLLPCSAHAAAPSARASKTVYSANWSHGLTGWIGAKAKGLTVSKGIVTYDGRGITDLIAPFKTGTMRDFALTASIKVLGANANATLVGFGLLVRQPANPSQSGIQAGIISQENGLNGPEIVWGANSIGGSDYLLSHGWETFRVDVHAAQSGGPGEEYSFSMGGEQKVAPTVITALHAKTRIGIWFLNTAMRVRNFKVQQLPSSPATSPQQPGALQQLLPDPAPGKLILLGGHFYSNEEYARIEQIDPQTVTSEGRLLSYSADLSATQGEMAYSITAFTGASGAQWEYDLEQQREQQISGYTPLTIPAIGDKSSGYSYTLQVGPDAQHLQTVTIDAIDFVLGTHRVHIEITSSTPDTALPVLIAEAQSVATKLS